MSRQLEKQSRQLARIEKVIQSIQSSFNKIDRQSNTMKQLYGVVTQLQRQMHRQIQQQQQRQRTQKKKGKDGITSPKK
jgi:chromosome segregation ATPase